MSHWGYGLVIGKFRPPHKGHGLLISTALARVDRLTVLVCADNSDTIPAELRATWLREIFPTVDVRVVETSVYDDEDSRLWAGLTRGWLGRSPDVVFSSEDYGEPYARFMHCEHVCVDRQRIGVPISGSSILQHPLANLHYLEAPVRAYFVRRIALLGAESTGKTTLARALARHYGTTWVPEYGRMYWEGLMTSVPLEPTTPDFEHIAQAQLDLEDRLARHAQRVLFCDTDALTTWLWHERYLESDAAKVRALAASRRYALYFLMGDEIPWEDDGTRDPPDKRGWLQRRITAELVGSDAQIVPLVGPFEDRLARAIEVVDALLDEA